MTRSLPITAVLDEVTSAIRDHRQVVLQAPPGAGKTTGVPLHLAASGVVEGRILMLEPRRVAARSAATYIASLMGEEPGNRVGYRMRGETCSSSRAEIEVVTEGVLTRMIQTDPDLPGIGCIIFDEFHERSLQADLGLALALEVRSALRPDLALVVMSATLDAGPVAALMGGAPLVTSEGRSFPVETRWLDRPWRGPNDRRTRLETAMAGAIRAALADHEGSLLAFLPGAGEIRRCQALLADLPGDCTVLPLYGALPFKDQMRALRPAPRGRRHVVLATSIAETSVTIPDVQIVVDGGLSRRPRFDPQSGMTKLVTERVAKAEADQRRGRAGRVSEGVCCRLWTRGEEGGLQPFAPVAIEDDDLMSLALDLARWGTRDPSDLAFLTQPPAPALAEARTLLTLFGALTDDGALTPHGAAIAALPLHPRLAQMVARARDLGMGGTACHLAALLDRRASTHVDMAEDLRLARDDKAVMAEVRRIGKDRDRAALSPGAVLSLAYPDRIARRRAPGDARFLLSGGRGAALRNDAAFSSADWLVAADLDGAGRDAIIRRAAAVDEAEIRELHGSAITTAQVCTWDKRQSHVITEEREMLGAIALTRRPAEPEPEALRAAMLDGIRQMGLTCLPWTKGLRQLCDRAAWANRHGAELPGMTDAALIADLPIWLGPFLDNCSRKAHLQNVNLAAALDARLGWEGRTALDRLAPTRFATPAGSSVAIHYDGEKPRISIRLQEMLGCTSHPTIGADRTPLLVELLSPAQRPIQTTADIPAFWATSYADLRKDMRGRYPRHPWPEDPANAAPTRRAKPRGT